LNKLEELYVQFSSESKVDPKLRDEARNWFKKLEQGDPEAKQIWEKVVAISKLEFEKVYDLLGVHIDNAHGESFYEDKVQAVIDEVIKKGLSRESEGAKIVEFDDMPPAMLVKSDGTTTYFARDLAAIRYRLNTFDPDIFVYEVGSEQTLHFRQVFKAVELLGWKMERTFVHIPHGLVLVDGKKMSTREGTNVGIQEVLDQAIIKAKALGKDADDDLAKKVGIGAVKYFDLSHQPASNINFDWNKMLSLEGNSGPYLQYSFARVNSLRKRSGVGTSGLEGLHFSKLNFGSDEMALSRKIFRFDDIIVSSMQMYSPNILCEYLFELARDFNGYYSGVKILGSENEESKLVLVAALGNVIKEGLGILGIEAPDSM
jgi:arginyl-tRNA synthetase